MSSHPRLHPSVTPGRVIGLLDLIATYGGRVDVARIAMELQSDVDDLLPVVDVAEELGFLRVENGDAVLTERGREFVASSPSKKKLMLREAIAKLEPFATALKLAKSREEFSAEELVEELSKLNIPEEEYEDPEQIHSMLLEWLLYTESINYNGEDKKFSEKRFTRRG